MVKVGAIAALALVAAPAAAELKSASDAAFVLERASEVAGPAREVWARLVAIERWWNGAHSYSGAARNLSLRPVAGGCFCERLPASGGSVEHGRVVYAEPGKQLRLVAALGPLQAGAVTGTLTWTITPGREGRLMLRQTYVVAGHVPGGLAALARPVDGVMSEQFDRLLILLRRP